MKSKRDSSRKTSKSIEQTQKVTFRAKKSKDKSMIKAIFGTKA